MVTGVGVGDYFCVIYVIKDRTAEGVLFLAFKKKNLGNLVRKRIGDYKR